MSFVVVLRYLLVWRSSEVSLELVRSVSASGGCCGCVSFWWPTFSVMRGFGCVGLIC